MAVAQFKQDGSSEVRRRKPSDLGFDLVRKLLCFSVKIRQIHAHENEFKLLLIIIFDCILESLGVDASGLHIVWIRVKEIHYRKNREEEGRDSERGLPMAPLNIQDQK